MPIAHAGSVASLLPPALVELGAYSKALAACYFHRFCGSGMVAFERYADTKGRLGLGDELCVRHLLLVPL